MPDPTGSAQPIEAYVEDARSLGAEAFEAAHGGAFLLLSTQLRPPQDTYSTHLELEGAASERTLNLATLVFPVRSPVHIITLGRAANNDVVVPDGSVSRQHAFVKRRDDGTHLILDAGSSNGTIVNGQNVLVRGHGAPTELKGGDSLRLGGIEFTFVDAEGLRAYAARLG